MAMGCPPWPASTGLAHESRLLPIAPATAATDHGRKLSGYFSLPSVQHYLILDPERRVAIHHKRGVGDAIETRVLSDGAIRLDPPGFQVAVKALFPLL